MVIFKWSIEPTYNREIIVAREGDFDRWKNWMERIGYYFDTFKKITMDEAEAMQYTASKVRIIKMKEA